MERGQRGGHLCAGVGVAADLGHHQRPKRAQRAGHRRVVPHAGRQRARRHSVARGAAAGRQRDQAAGLEFAQQRARGHVLEATGRGTPVPGGGERPRQLTSTPSRMHRLQRADLIEIRRGDHAPLQDHRHAHARQHAKSRRWSPVKSTLSSPVPMRPGAALEAVQQQRQFLGAQAATRAVAGGPAKTPAFQALRI